MRRQDRSATTARPTLSMSTMVVDDHPEGVMKSREIPSTHVKLREFLVLSGMSKGTFFLGYRHDPMRTELLDIRTDRMHHIWLARRAAEVLREERRAKESHGNRGRAPVRICIHCGHRGHPRHRACIACLEEFQQG